MNKFLPLLLLFTCIYSTLHSQTTIIDGYVYESGNRGFLNTAKIEVFDNSGSLLASAFSDVDGHFELEVLHKEVYTIRATKDMFETAEVQLDSKTYSQGLKLFPKVEMKRAPGYIFEITLAEKSENKSQAVDAIKGSLIEVYNNTLSKQVLTLTNHQDPEFRVSLLKGNHYTILIRKEGFVARRLEAFVDVEGCILCFEGLGSIEPGVSDNLSEGNNMGVLLANVELERIFEGKKIEINNLYYDFAKWDIKKEAEEELDKVVTLMGDNPELIIELGSHTDARGKSSDNMVLSEKRAKSAVNYLVDKGVDRLRIIAKGYGESEIINRCQNGVDCSDNEHLQNRRTELKIIGVSSQKSKSRSLSDLKKDEQMDELLEEIQFGGQVKVDEEVSAEELDSLLNTNQLSIELDIEIQSDSLDEQQITETINLDIDQETVETDNNESIEIEEPVETFVKVVTQESSEGFSGIKIAIKVSRTQLESDHEIYKVHNQVLEVNEGEIYMYAIGSFNDKDEAKEFLNSTIKMVYPTAFIIELKNGQLIR